MAKVHCNTRLHLLVPGLLEPIRNFGSLDATLSVPFLEKLLSRGDRQYCTGKDYLTTLFSLFDYPLSEKQDLPEGAVNYFAGGGNAAGACWMRADPVHLRADRDRLLLFNCEPLDIRASETEAIARLFNEYFAQEPIQLLTHGPERWYLKLEHCPELQTHGLSQVVGHHIESFMPEGRDARRWRQLLNEMQMLLFQSTINQQREAEARLTINSIWLSGIGRLPEVTPGGFDTVYSDDSAAVGLAGLAQIQTKPVPANGTPWREGADNLMVLTDLISPILNVDGYRWSEAMNGLEQAMGSVVDAMQQIKQAQLVLYPCNGESYWVTASALRRFWRRTKKLPALLSSSRKK